MRMGRFMQRWIIHINMRTEKSYGVRKVKLKGMRPELIRPNMIP